MLQYSWLELTRISRKLRDIPGLQVYNTSSQCERRRRRSIGNDTDSDGGGERFQLGDLCPSCNLTLTLSLSRSKRPELGMKIALQEFEADAEDGDGSGTEEDEADVINQTKTDDDYKLQMQAFSFGYFKQIFNKS